MSRVRVNVENDQWIVAFQVLPDGSSQVVPNPDLSRIPRTSARNSKVEYFDLPLMRPPDLTQTINEVRARRYAYP